MKAFCLFIIVVGILACAQPVHAADKWLSIQSPNFLLVGNGGESQIRQVGRALEQFRAALAILFPNVGQQSSTGTTVLVFKDDSSFKPYKPLYEGKPANIAGYFQSGSDVNFIALNGEIETPRIIYHEFVHSLTKDATHRLPSWANEGLAEFYSTFTVSGKDIELGRPIAEHVVLLRDKVFIPLDTFLTVGPGSPYYNEQSKQGMFYAQSWALVHYLMVGNRGQRRPQFTKYLSLLDGSKPEAECFQEAFQTDYAGMERELRDYIQLRMTWPGFKIPLEQKLDFDRTTQISPLSEAAADYYIGDLLLHINRIDAAEKELTTAISLDAGFGGSYSAMGMLRLRQDRDKEALEFLTKAVANDSPNPMAHYYYARALARVTDDPSPADRTRRLQLMRTHLKQSIELAPRFVEAYSLLGNTTLSLRDDLDATETALGKAIAFAPGREDLRLTLAQVMTLNKKDAAARAVLTAVRNTSTDLMIRERAAMLLDNLTNRMASEQSLREYEERRPAVASGKIDEPPKLTHQETSSSPSEPEVETSATFAGHDVPGLKVEGSLAAIDCTSGMTLQVRVGNGLVLLHAADPSKIDFVSYMNTVKDSIACGPVKPELKVIITYKRIADPAFLGEPLVVEFRELWERGQERRRRL